MSFQRRTFIIIGWRLAEQCPDCSMGLFLVILGAADPATGVLKVPPRYEIWPRGRHLTDRLLTELVEDGDIEVDRARGRPPHITVLDYYDRWTTETRWLVRQQLDAEGRNRRG